ncbi:hypothetical protein VTJ49DRAFT_3926 [Mycothermus thermophilus]|uniref:Uncharacterized protein n=1 Tax=Humicola insolens TaxID=85995 RepID=A0ABR3V6K6_HUMIN
MRALESDSSRASSGGIVLGHQGENLGLNAGGGHEERIRLCCICCNCQISGKIDAVESFHNISWLELQILRRERLCNGLWHLQTHNQDAKKIT